MRQRHTHRQSAAEAAADILVEGIVEDNPLDRIAGVAVVAVDIRSTPQTPAD